MLAACVMRSRKRAARRYAGRVTALYCYPSSVSPAVVERPFAIFGAQAQRDGVARDVRPLSVGSCSGIDFATSKSDNEIPRVWPAVH